MQNRKRPLIQWLGLLGVVSLLSYTAAVVFSPLAYPGYCWMEQAVSDLSAENAPSRMLWNQLAAPYGVCGIVSVMMVCVYVRDRLSKTLRTGISLFAAMNWISTVGYGMFPLSQSGYAGTFQDIMHTYIVTVLVVLLSVISLLCVLIGGFQDPSQKPLALWAGVTLLLLCAGAIGTGVVPRAYFGIAERFSVFAATGFTAVLGVCLFRGFPPALAKETPHRPC